MKRYGVTGWKNCGKTGLMERLVHEFCARGFRVSTVKRAHHHADIDQPGRDSYRHREAGAAQVMLATPDRWALMHELRDAPEPGLDDLVAKMDEADILLIEGFKHAPHPKIETHRRETGADLIAPVNPTIRAVAADHHPAGLSVPILGLNDTQAIADFILSDLGLPKENRASDD